MRLFWKYFYKLKCRLGLHEWAIPGWANNAKQCLVCRKGAIYSHRLHKWIEGLPKDRYENWCNRIENKRQLTLWEKIKKAKRAILN